MEVKLFRNINHISRKKHAILTSQLSILHYNDASQHDFDYRIITN